MRLICHHEKNRTKKAMRIDQVWYKKLTNNENKKLEKLSEGGVNKIFTWSVCQSERAREGVI